MLYFRTVSSHIVREGVFFSLPKIFFTTMAVMNFDIYTFIAETGNNAIIWSFLDANIVLRDRSGQMFNNSLKNKIVYTATMYYRA